MWNDKRRTYLWLICPIVELGCSICSKVGSLRVMKTQGLSISIERSSSLIDFQGKTRSVQLASLRKKCHRLANSQVHVTASNIEKPAKDDKEYVGKWLWNHQSATGTRTRVAKANLKQEEDSIQKFLYFDITILQHYGIGYLFFEFQISINIGFLYSLDKKIIKVYTVLNNLISFNNLVIK